MVECYLADVMASGQEQGGVSLAGLASGVIFGIPHVARFALTLEASYFVYAYLRALSGNFALIDILAVPLVRRQLVTLVAFAVVAHLQIDALVHAASVLRGALVYPALSCRLVLAIRTILPLVADLREWNALTSTAVEFAGCVASSLVDPQTQTQSAIPFVAAIGAVLVAVAGEMSWNAAAIAALELVRPAGDVLAVGRVLIVAIRTVAVTIAEPAVMQAGDAILALVFVR